ncbi:MAG: alpha/beta hydrolase domain-containing protein [Candidatus Binatia bacterium]
MHTEVRFFLKTREPFADGMIFGDVGPYERLVGRILLAVDPDAPAQRGVVDLNHAPRNATGLVEFSVEFYILKPVELARGNRRLLYDVVNRGNKRVLQFFNDAPHSNAPWTSEHAGNGFLMRRGYTVVWSAWQGDILPIDGRMTMELPVAGINGSEITGIVRSEFIADQPGILSLPLSANHYTRSYESTTLDTATATFTCREHEGDTRQPIPSHAWQFARLGADGNPIPSNTDCYLKEGFRPGWIYELIYLAKNPPVLGLGFTGVRDVVSFLRNKEIDADGTPNPLHENSIGMEKAYAWGRSLSGRFLREFIYLGFNQDDHGCRIFDGTFPHVTGGGRVSLNYRFAQPGRHPRQHEDHLYPSDQFPFAYAISTDPFSGKRDAILKRPETDPLVIHTQTSTEYWQRRGSLVHTDPLGNDLVADDRARIYLFASAQHFAEANATPEHGIHRHLSNPLNVTPLLRALLDALDRWATDNVPPPQSRIPTRADGTLVSVSVLQAQFPRIPDVECPREPNRLFLQDYGPDSARGIFLQEPPVVDKTREYAVLVPLVDSDGNDVAGARTPHVEVPIATFTGWNIRPKEYGPRILADLSGSYLPFCRTAVERNVSGDPRPSLTERYRSKAYYIRRIAAAVQKLVDERLILEEDANRYVEAAMNEKGLD